MKKILLSIILFALSQQVQAVLKIDITQGIEGALPIAIVPFQWNTEKVLNGDVSAIVLSDLARSGQFSPMPESELIAKPQKPEDVHFKTWRVAGVDHLVIGSVNRLPDGQYQVQFRLFDVLKGKQVLGYSFPATEKTLRSVAHQISDYIFTALTGEPGAFNTRIAYVTVQRDKVKGSVSRLQVSDTDGYNPQTLLTSDEPIMSPAWSPDGARLAYVSFEKGRAEIYTHNIHTGVRELQSSYAGLNGSPAWSPDGRKLAITLSKDGSPDIYILDLSNKALQQVTNHWSIDTEAAWMPDGKSLIFTSSRSGKPQLYQLFLKDETSKVAGKPKAKRLTFDGDYNASASVSADGKSIAFVQGAGRHYRIALMNITTQSTQVLTHGEMDESPEFAPNNSMVLFATQEKNNAILAAVSIDGKHKQRLTFTEGEVREPSWAAVRH